VGDTDSFKDRAAFLVLKITQQIPTQNIDVMTSGDYVVGGFAFVAYPAEYGNSGIMTFMINQDGVLLEKDLGKTTTQTAAAMTEFDPDEGWTVVQQ